MKNVFLFFRNGGAEFNSDVLAYYFLTCDLSAQIFRWDMNLGNCTPSNCDVNTYDRFVSCSGNGQLYSASSPSKIVINNSCGWLNGLGNLPVSTYYPINVNGVGNNYNYLIDGSLYYLTNSTYNGLPLNSGGNIIGHGGPSKSGIFLMSNNLS